MNDKIIETASLMLEFEFSEFREIFSTLQKFTELGISYKVIVAETRETGFPILELSGEKKVIEEALTEFGYMKDVLEIDEKLESEEELDDEDEPEDDEEMDVEDVEAAI